MSTVDKMLIKGIRSFDPENKNVITFFTPLTLIVGPNGAGKTVAGETETKGQIKLRFKTAARKDVVCIRSFQLTQKATKMEYKAIESVLQKINPQAGELRESIAQYEARTATLNSQIEELDPKIQNIDREINKTELLLKDLRELQGQIATKSGKENPSLRMFTSAIVTLMRKVKVYTDEELNEWKSKFDERIAVLETKVNKLLREKMDNKETSRHLEDDIAKNIKEIAKLQALIEIAQLSQKDKRDSTIRSLIRKHNLARRRFVESKLQSLDPQAGGIDSYLKMLETAKERRDDLSRDYNVSDGMGRMFEPFEKIASAHHYCPCCESPFSSNEEDAFIKKQRVKALDLTERLKLLEVQSSNADFHFQQLDKLRVVYDEYVKTGKKLIPLAEKNLHDLNEDFDLKHQALDDVLGVDALIQPVGTVDRLFQEMQALQKQVNELESKLDIQAQGLDAKSLEEIISELKSLEKERNTLIDDTEKLRTEQMTMEKKISSLQSRWSIVREEKINVANILSNIKRVEDELDRLLEDKSQVDLDLKVISFS
ncbi:hypothetical protein SASPL_152029 [Salvia splendens]|uniref:DNA repair protein RAD50 n=1 Tax=Salvia splendens TaxID=180675 RepID=A0A8X8Z0X3_SALSN|nr:hypothetical protein SASPL_152029 [Salvia splendens]